MNQIEKKDYYNFLYAYYQNLLTDKQRKIFESYYFDDYSLSEIANAEEVSRNAIWDILKKVEHNLDEYETKLHLFEQDKKRTVYLNQLEAHLDEEGKEILKKIKEME